MYIMEFTIVLKNKGLHLFAEAKNKPLKFFIDELMPRLLKIYVVIVHVYIYVYVHIHIINFIICISLFIILLYMHSICIYIYIRVVFSYTDLFVISLTPLSYEIQLINFNAYFSSYSIRENKWLKKLTYFLHLSKYLEVEVLYLFIQICVPLVQYPALYNEIVGLNAYFQQYLYYI